MIKLLNFGLFGGRFCSYDQVICRKLQVRSPIFCDQKVQKSIASHRECAHARGNGRRGRLPGAPGGRTREAMAGGGARERRRRLGQGRAEARETTAAGGGAHQEGTRGRRWRAEAHAREATVVGDKGERRHAGRRRRLGARAGGGERGNGRRGRLRGAPERGAHAGRRRRCKRQEMERRDSRGSSSAANGWGAGGKGAAGKSAGRRRKRPGDAAAPSIKTTALSRTGRSAARRCRCRCRRSGDGGPCWRSRGARRCAGRPGS